MERIILIGLVLLIGFLQPVQAAMNAEFGRIAGHPLRGSIVNMYLGALAITLVLLVTRTGPPGLAAFKSAPWWSMLGGLIGATLVTVMLFSAPRLGVALMAAVFIVGQLASSVTIDHFGWLGIPEKRIDMGRVVGLLMLVGGVVLIERSGAGAAAVTGSG